MLRIINLYQPVLIIAFSFCFSGGCKEKAADKKPPVNILVLLSDDQRYDAAGFAGNEIIQTPNLDNLAHNGVYFRNTFVMTPVCWSSRATIMSGLYPAAARYNKGISSINIEETYSAYLKNNGYYIGFIGKWGVSSQKDSLFRNECNLFDFWGGSMYQSNYWHERNCNFVRNNGTTEKYNFLCDCPPDSRGVSGEKVRVGNANMKDPVHQETFVIPNKVRSFLDQRDANKPFCLSISFKSPHNPRDYDPVYEHSYDSIPMRYAASVDEEDALGQPDFLKFSSNTSKGVISDIKNKEDLNGNLQNSIRTYYRMINGLDNSVGQIVQELKDRGLFENTVILFLSDNGFFSYEHGFHGKWLMYEESIRVPGFIFDPRNQGNKRIADEMVLNLDIAPTVLDLAGIAIPEQMEGKSLLPLMQKPDPDFRNEFFASHYYGGAKGSSHIERSECVRTKEWKYISYIDQQGTDSEELFNMVDDPLEMNDLSKNSEYFSLMDKMRKRHKYYFQSKQETMK